MAKTRILMIQCLFHRGLGSLQRESIIILIERRQTGKVLKSRPLRSTRPRSPAILQQLRRSARIAALQDHSGVTVAPPRTVEISRRKSRRKVAQVPTPPLSTGSSDL